MLKNNSFEQINTHPTFRKENNKIFNRKDPVSISSDEMEIVKSRFLGNENTPTCQKWSAARLRNEVIRAIKDKELTQEDLFYILIQIGSIPLETE